MVSGFSFGLVFKLGIPSGTIKSQEYRTGRRRVLLVYPHSSHRKRRCDRLQLFCFCARRWKQRQHRSAMLWHARSVGLTTLIAA